MNAKVILYSFHFPIKLLLHKLKMLTPAADPISQRPQTLIKKNDFEAVEQRLM